MASKFGLMLSMIFVALFFAFGIDLMTVQFIYSDLDAKSISISYEISQYGTIDDALVLSIQNKYNVSFVCVDNCTPLFGDVVTYKLIKSYKPIVISKTPLEITIQRNAIIGYLS